MVMKLSNLTRTHQLVLGSIMAAINVLFAILSSYVFAFSLLIMLFLPLASVIVALNIDLKFYPVYFLGTMFLALILNFANIENTLFFLLPILASGLTFGLLIKHNIPDILILVIVSCVNLTTLLITIPIINLIYSINFLETSASFIGFTSIDYGKLIVPSILTLLAFGQTLITLLVISVDARYFRITINAKPWKYTSIVNLLFIGLYIGFIFWNEGIALALLFVLFLLSIYALIGIYQKHKLSGYIASLISFAFLFIGIAITEQFIPVKAYFGLLFAVVPIVITDILWLYINSRKKEELNG